MKHLLLIGALICATTITNGNANSKVYICKGPNSTKYHCIKDCQGLKKCSTEIYEMTEQQAIDAGRSRCGFCYRNK